MGATTYMLERDLPPHHFDSTYQSILKSAPDSIALVKQLREMVTGTFVTLMRLSNIGPANVQLYVNNKPCLVRKRKNAYITVYPGTTIVMGTDTGSGGSIQYPAIAFKEGVALVEVITDGFPHMDMNMHNMTIEIIGLDRINT